MLTLTEFPKKKKQALPPPEKKEIKPSLESSRKKRKGSKKASQKKGNTSSRQTKSPPVQTRDSHELLPPQNGHVKSEDTEAQQRERRDEPDTHPENIDVEYSGDHY